VTFGIAGGGFLGPGMEAAAHVFNGIGEKRFSCLVHRGHAVLLFAYLGSVAYLGSAMMACLMSPFS
jgi:hypothetical protein